MDENLSQIEGGGRGRKTGSTERTEEQKNQARRVLRREQEKIRKGIEENKESDSIKAAKAVEKAAKAAEKKAEKEAAKAAVVASSRTQSSATNIVNRLNDISIKIEKKIKEIEVPSIQSPNINNIIKTLNESFVTINKLDESSVTINKLDKKSISNIINILNNSFKKISEQNKEDSDDQLEQFFNKLQKNTTNEGNKLKLHLVSAMEYFINHDMYSTDKESSQHKYINKRIAEIKSSNSNSEPSDIIENIFKKSFDSTSTITVAA